MQMLTTATQIGHEYNRVKCFETLATHSHHNMFVYSANFRAALFVVDILVLVLGTKLYAK
jgi:hypothetical protein